MEDNPLRFAQQLDFVGGNSPAFYYPVDNIAVNCGFSGKSSSAIDGQQWIGDIGSKYIISQGSKVKLISSTPVDRLFSVNPVPYGSARISRSQFTYRFQVSAGPKFIRLHFCPASYPGFKRSKDFFTVKAGPYTLLSNFSASLTADALGLQSFAKEFCVNVEENQPLIVTFSPSTDGTLDEVYAFVNGIEIVSLPTGLYHTLEGDPGAHVAGKKYRFPIDESIALELVQRLNVGGSSILSIEDTGMFREWSEDSNHLLESSRLPVSTTIRIKYTTTPTYSAPQKVYQTSWSMVLDQQANKTFNFTWKLPVDLGFRYLLRFHFCELEYEIKESGHMVFKIFVNNQMVEANADIIKWSGSNGVAVYRDYVLTMEGDRMKGKRDMVIVLCPHNHSYEWRTTHIDAILKGLEVFKLSNPDNNLAGVNPVPVASGSIFGNPNPQKFVFASGGNVIATGVVIFLCVLNIIIYQLRILGDKFGEKNFSSLPSEESCCRFSLAEIQSVTNNFNDELVIGSGGFGKVYKALLIDGVETTVAIKRLNSNSKQGAHEFWTEIEMLSKFRHMHLVSLIGYCEEGHEMILVYEYMEHGTLADHLYKINTSGNICHLSWEQRLNICIDAARGLDYLHTGTQHGIIHRDVKTTNILIDKDWVAKISDFGLCKMGTTSHSRTHVSTDVKGTFGYLDPEYFLTRRLTKKSDVYAFGIVLLEVLCGRVAVDIRLEEEQRSLALWAQHCIREKKLDQIIDPSLKDQISPHCLKVFAEVASKCLHNRPNGRPTMADVVVSLECALAAQDQCRDIQADDALPQGTVPSCALVAQDQCRDIRADDAGTVPPPSTPVQYCENIPQAKKSSMGKLNNVFQSIIALLGKGMNVRWRKTKVYDSNSGMLQWDSSTPRLHGFSIREIKEATNDFYYELEIGDGGFSKVYKGWINHKTVEVVVKRLTSGAIPTDIHVQSQLCHLHIMSLIGYCCDEGEQFLVYNYGANGSLCDHLYGMDRGYTPLPWEKRLEICIGAGQGLQYLHSRHEIIHGNIKPAHILLDKNLVAKVSDCWLPNVVGVTTLICDNLEYLDPEYIQYLRLTEKSDIYSFGVVLFEVLCARNPCDPSLKEDRKMQYAGSELVIAPECLREFVKIAWNCLLDRGTERPSMYDVVGSLNIALQLQQIWHNDIEVGSSSHNDLVKERFCHAHNNVLSYDGAFDISDPDTGTNGLLIKKI
ncbi:unnamed protein product [Camellia sinensis]